MHKPKQMMVIDGNEAAAYAAYAFSEVAAIYPITPSSPMAEKTDEWSANGKLNLFGQTVTLVEMQSEAGAIGAVHGALEAGALATSYTSSQGLMLMIPVMHRIAGTRQPGVLHVAARTVGAHAMSIFGDHSDVMNCRGTGFAMLASSSVQEVMDMAALAHLSAIKGRVPFMHFFDGFRTSHEMQKIEALDYADLAELQDWQAVKLHRDQALNPEHPTLRNTVQNPDVFFQFREAANPAYAALPALVEDYMHRISDLTGRDYRLFNYHGAPDAERVLIAMGSVCGTARETVADMLTRGEKVGLLEVHLYRPFSAEHFLATLPAAVRRIAVLDRTKEPGATGEPLYQDVCTVFANREHAPEIYGGRYGLSSKDTDPAQIEAVFNNLAQDMPKNNFTIGITDDVSLLSLPLPPARPHSDKGMVSCKFWGLGSDGTVGANKNSIKIIGEATDLYAQAYFEYDSKKSFGLTKSHLRFGKKPILSTYLVKQADFIACHNQSYLRQYDMLSELKPGGSFLLNCAWQPEELEQQLPAAVKRALQQQQARFYIIDANAIARHIGLGDHNSMVLQAAFFALADIIPIAEAAEHMKQAVAKTFRKKGENVVRMNMEAIDQGIGGMRLIEIPTAWAEASDPPTAAAEEPDFIRQILRPLNAGKGDELPVSAFLPYADGTMPLGSTAYEKRGIATRLPQWQAEHCLQCNRCSFVCPHAVIRPYLLDATEAAAAPEGFAMVAAKGAKAVGLNFSLQISAADCTGCGCCAAVCPVGEQALTMHVAGEAPVDPAHWPYALSISDKPDLFDAATVKGSQFRQPLCEFSGACAGCGETPYAKLLTQLFGDKIYWANATGCSQAWGSPMPSFPYTTNKQGKGPAWSNSLFENNAEFSLGMALAVNQQRAKLKQQIERLRALSDDAALAAAIDTWLQNFYLLDASATASEQLATVLAAARLDGEADELRAAILGRRDHLNKKTIWMYGGDGWAYDIGYGGLDHVVALGEDVNIFVVDTEVYSNTGGQSSKATPLGAVAQFQAAGKKSAKKDLGKLMMGYGNCYVASVAMGADPAQLVKAVSEAEAFPGPSLIVAYTPCISHGIKLGMDQTQAEMKRAVEAGYWTLYRYDPRRKAEGKNPFQLDSKPPTLDFETFLRGETRYAALDITFPDNAQALFAQAAVEARERYEQYRRLAEQGGA
jgi:pyruvate-ferredoxin/flavodoxin oxidoreductase